MIFCRTIQALCLCGLCGVSGSSQEGLQWFRDTSGVLDFSMWWHIGQRVGREEGAWVRPGGTVCRFRIIPLTLTQQHGHSTGKPWSLCGFRGKMESGKERVFHCFLFLSSSSKQRNILNTVYICKQTLDFIPFEVPFRRTRKHAFYSSCMGPKPIFIRSWPRFLISQTIVWQRLK